MLTKELHFNYYHLEGEALFYTIIVISYSIQAYIILLKSGMHEGWGGGGVWVGGDGGEGALNLNMFEYKTGLIQ